MTLAELAETSKLFSICILLLLVLCGISNAQSTFSSQKDTVTKPSGYLIPHGTPVHGFGVTSLSSYYPDSSFIEAHRLAVEDLKANLLTSIYLESFGTNTLNTSYEFAIRETIDRQSVVKIDSLSKDGKAYFFVTVDSLNAASTNDRSRPNYSNLKWTTDIFNPTESDGYWIAAGNAKMSEFNPYKSWARSKLDALSSLARLLQTKIQSSFSVQDYSAKKVSYITTKVIFQQVMVLERRLKNDRCYTLIAVHKRNITRL